MAHIEQATSVRDQTINIRAGRAQRDLIDRAAQAVNKSRSEFMLEAACREAEDVLLDQTFLQLDPEAFDRFSELLDHPPAPSEALRQLLLTEAPWNRDDDDRPNE